MLLQIDVFMQNDLVFGETMFKKDISWKGFLKPHWVF